MSDLLRLGLETKPEEVALLSNRRAPTWAELEDASSRVAAGYLGLGLRATLSVAGRVVVARATDAHELLPLLREQRPTELLTWFAAAAGFPIVEGYGMTEVGLATLNPPSGEIRQGSIGTPINGFKVELRDDQGALVEGDAVGRIWIETPSAMVGYWEAPEATAEVIVDGWLDSGDLARADADGYLCFFGRKKQVIVHDGSNISPYEVEGALVDHPAVALAGAVGVHDTVHGENVRAYVTVDDGVEKPSAADLIVHCRERIGYKAPEEIVFLEEMPLNPTGKIDRAGLKRMAEDHLHPHGL